MSQWNMAVWEESCMHSQQHEEGDLGPALERIPLQAEHVDVSLQGLSPGIAQIMPSTRLRFVGTSQTARTAASATLPMANASSGSVHTRPQLVQATSSYNCISSSRPAADIQYVQY